MSIAAGMFIFAAWFAGTFLGTVTGMGGPLLSVPAMAFVVGMHGAVPAANVQSVCVALWLAWGFRKDIHAGPLALMLACCVPGLLFGEQVLLAVGGNVLAGVLGVVLLMFVAWKFLSPGLRVARFRGLYTAATGFLAGLATSTIAASGPVVGVYAVLMGWNSRETRAILGVFFLFLASGTVGLELYHGLFGSGTVDALKWGLPGMLTGMAAGIPCGKRISETRYMRWVLYVLLAAGVSSLVNAFR